MAVVALLSLLLPISFSFETPLSSVKIIQPPPPIGERGPPGLRNRAVFTLPVSIGTPPQTIPLIVDTWRNSTTVYDPDCKYCKGDNRFFRNLSKSFTLVTQPGQLTDEIVRGTDVVDLSGNGSFRMANHSIEVVMNTDGVNHYGNGFFRLNPENEILSRMHCAEYIDKRAFAVFFTGNGSSNVSRSGLDPVISWGSWNVKKYSTREKFEFVDIVSETEWKIRVDSVKFGDLELAGKDSYAILDTKEGRFTVPDTIYKSDFKPLINKLLGEGGRNHYCSVFDIDLPDIVITIGSVSISIPKEVYVYNNGANCSSEIAHYLKLEDFVFGVPFFQSAYVLFDIYNQRIGIAPSRNAKERQETKQWPMIWVFAAALAVVGAVVGVVCYCKRKKRVEAMYNDTIEQLISARHGSQLPG